MTEEMHVLKTELHCRINQVAQLSADVQGYRERLTAAHALIATLKAELRGAKSLMRIDAEKGSQAYAGAIDRINTALKRSAV